MSPALLLAAALWGLSLEPADVGGRARAVLRQDDYQFCHDDKFPLTWREARWCPVLAGESPRCPALIEACKAPRGELDVQQGGGRANARRVLDEGDTDTTGQGDEQESEAATTRDSAGDDGTRGAGNDRASAGDVPPDASAGDDLTSGQAPEATPTSGGEVADDNSAGNASDSDPKTSGDHADTSGSDGTTKAEKKRKKREFDRRYRDSDDRDPISRPNDTQTGFGQVLFWLVIIGGALAIISLLLRARMGLASEDEADSAEPDGAVEDEEVVRKAQPRGPVLTDVEALLQRAEQSGSRGDFRQAIADCHAALLRNLEHAELITVIRSRTNGEYVRDLAGRGDLQTSVREIMVDVDRAHYSTEDPEKSVFSRVLTRVRTLVRSGIQGLVFALLTTTIVACAWSSGSKWKSYRWQTTPSGNAGLIELAEAYDLELRERTLPLVDIDADTSTLILYHGAEPEEDEWEAIDEWVRRGGKLVVTGTVTGLPDWVGAKRRYDSREVAELSVVESRWYDFGQPDLRVPGGDRLELDGASALLLIDGSEVYAANHRVGAGEVVTLADDVLLTNAALAVADDAAFILALLRSLGDDAEYVDASAWIGADTPFSTVGRTELLPALLQGLALLLLLYLWRGILFGAPRDPPRKSRRAFSQHVEAVGVHYARARVSRHALRLYASWAMGRLRDQAGSSHRRGLLPLAQAVAERTGRDETEVMRILVEAHAASQESITHDDPGSGNLEDLQLMRELAYLVERAGGTR